ncbi:MULTISPECIES: hypothetical protein [Roseobacteraceae]|uniref:hypothetical protein n=1 Tax=Roseobacteraceae TaxID=2854170 RepID=UPI00080AA121|nr:MULTISPECIES: hypothetical protein [Roseobacteraceae]ANT61831.1 hypothetical protein AYJ57_15310 [Salipiger sp. CCB-MM3]MCA0997745.1 hypothetical protein [Alloyangia pacifica]NDW01211.1 hypothetical protein [Salipiger sp. PrR002]
MTDERRIEEGDLGPLFEAERRDAALPSGDWMARMEALALAEQPAPRPADVPRAAASRGGGWRAALRAFGGWPAMAGLAAACAAGVWIGVASPDAMSTLISYDTSSTLSALDPSSGFDYAMLGL